MEKYNLYLDAFIKTIENYKHATELSDIKMYVKRAIFYGVKWINLKEVYDKTTIEKVEDTFTLASSIKSLIGLLTPGELITIFPIDKVYDGAKWETKDYFYTMDCINKLDPNELIGADNVLNLLWDYTNIDLMLFSINIMGYISDLRQGDGYPSLFEEWTDKEGIAPSPNIHRNNKDERFIVRSGKIEMLDKPKQSHLRIVK